MSVNTHFVTVLCMNNTGHLLKGVLYILATVRATILAKRVVQACGVGNSFATSANKQFLTLIGSCKTRTDTGFAVTQRQSSGVMTSPTVTKTAFWPRLFPCADQKAVLNQTKHKFSLFSLPLQRCILNIITTGHFKIKKSSTLWSIPISKLTNHH